MLVYIVTNMKVFDLFQFLPSQTELLYKLYKINVDYPKNVL